jgi:hypothetical protein
MMFSLPTEVEGPAAPVDGAPETRQRLGAGKREHSCQNGSQRPNRSAMSTIAKLDLVLASARQSRSQTTGHITTTAIGNQRRQNQVEPGQRYQR